MERRPDMYMCVLLVICFGALKIRVKLVSMIMKIVLICVHNLISMVRYLKLVITNWPYTLSCLQFDIHR